MLDRDNWQEIFSVLQKNKLRTFLTAFGVIWGVFMLLVMLGAGNGMRNGITGIFANFTTNGLDVNPGKTSKPYKGMNRDRQIKFYNEDVSILRRQVPEIAHIAPGVYVHQNIVNRGTSNGSFSVMGNSDEFMFIDKLRFDYGRFFNYREVKEVGKVAVLGQRVYEQLFREGGDPTGKYIKINGLFFMVIGKFTSTHDGGWADWQNGIIFIPYTTAQRTFKFGNELHFFSVEGVPGISVSDLSPKITGVLSSIHKVDPSDTQAFFIQDYSLMFKNMMNLVTGIYILVWIVGSFTLLAGIIGISNIMLIVVKERTKEIGVKRAIGATPRNIISQILLETAFLTTVSGYVGFLLAIGVLELAGKALAGSQNMMFRNPGVDFGVAVACITILVVAGTLAGLIPARRAVSIKPIDAIRD